MLKIAAEINLGNGKREIINKEEQQLWSTETKQVVETIDKT